MRDHKGGDQIKISVVIPARAGSKRIPDKNNKSFVGEPIISRVIKTVSESGIFERIIVSTDSLRIKEIAEDAGAMVPFMRPDEISGDYTDTSTVISHAASFISNNYGSKDPVMCIYPTAVFVQKEDLALCVKEFETGKWEFVFSGFQPSNSALRMFGKTDEGGCEMYFPEFFNHRSQDLPKSFADAGMFYLAEQTTWHTQNPIFSSRSTLIEIPRLRAIDINVMDDWILAESIYKVNLEKGEGVAKY